MKHKVRGTIVSVLVIAWVSTWSMSCSLFDEIGPQGALPEHVLFVDGSVSESGDGRSWATAYKELQEAIDAAADLASATVPWAVWVRAGTYAPQSSPHMPSSSDPKEYHYTLRSYVAVHGGFSGDETALEKKSGEETILSGEISGSSGDRTYHILYHPADAGIEGASMHDVTFSGGSASGFDASKNQMKGGAIYLGANSSTYFPSTRSSILFENCKFTDNSAQSMGGAIFIDDVDGVLFDACLFSRNHAKAGGNAVTLENCSPSSEGNAWVRFEGCGFLDNSNVSGTTSADNSGGGGAIQIHESKVRIDFCTFMRNTTAGDGGAIAIHYGDGSLDTDAIIANSLLTKNNAGDNGGGLYIEHGGRTVVFGSTIADNNALLSDAIYLENGYFITLLNTLIAGSASGEDLIAVTGSDTTIDDLIQGLTVDDGEVRMNIIQGFGSTDDASLMDCASGSMFIESDSDNRESESDYHLFGSSCAIDVGSTEASLGYAREVDLAGNTRVVGTHIDVGAFEYQGP